MMISWSHTLTHATPVEQECSIEDSRLDDATSSRLWEKYRKTATVINVSLGASIYTLNIYTLISIYIHHIHVPYIFGLPVETRTQPDSNRWVICKNWCNRNFTVGRLFRKFSVVVHLYPRKVERFFLLFFFFYYQMQRNEEIYTYNTVSII